MEFKDRLKELRKKRKLSQTTLASAIYVSRSAIAKWENGLGLPSKDSYDALLHYFDVTENELPLNPETEEITVPKNRTIHTLRAVLCSALAALLILLPLILLYAFDNGYGFTSRMAAGKGRNNDAYINTQKFDFYYDLWVFNTAGSEGYTQDYDLQIIDHFCVVKRLPIGYQRLNDLDQYKREIYSEDGKQLGCFYVFFDGAKYHYLFQSLLIGSPGEGITMSILSEIKIKEERIPLLHACYFTWNFPVTEFEANGILYTVKQP